MIAMFRSLLLAALLVRALLPAGWMPGQASLGEAAFIICTAQGDIQHGAPAQDGQNNHQQPCAFAAIPALDKTPGLIALAAPLPRTDFRAPVSPLYRTAHAARAAPQSPRAPPLTV
jgi:hypothetical protein